VAACANKCEFIISCITHFKQLSSIRSDCFEVFDATSDSFSLPEQPLSIVSNFGAVDQVLKRSKAVLLLGFGKAAVDKQPC
jgi:hypothetical protein